MKQGSLSSRIMFVGLALVIAALACSAPGGEQQVSTPAPDAVSATPAPTDGSTSVCPQAGDGTTLFTSQDDGFCFLYPSEMKAGASMQQGVRAVGITGEPLDPNSPEPVAAHLEVSYTGPADVSDAVEYALKWHGIYAIMASEPVPTTIAGQQAAVIPNVEGMLPQQVAFFVVNGQKYTISSSAPDAIADLKPQVEKLWNTVTGSIVFFAPGKVAQVVVPADVCPTSQEVGAIQFVDWAGGVCMLYPASFEINAEFGHGTGWFEGGDILGELFSRPIKAELVIAYAGPAQGKTPRQLFEPRLANAEVSQIDVAGAQDTTLSGNPAIVWTEGSPIGSRQAIIVVNDRMYTVVNQPYNDPNYPGGEANVDLIWTVTENLAFFDPWH